MPGRTSPLARNELICWVEDAKQETTRERRIRRTQEELEEGQRRPCCWPGCKHRERAGKDASAWDDPGRAASSRLVRRARRQGNAHQNGRRLAAHRAPRHRSQDLVVCPSGHRLVMVTLSAYVTFAVRYMVATAERRDAATGVTEAFLKAAIADRPRASAFEASAAPRDSGSTCAHPLDFADERFPFAGGASRLVGPTATFDRKLAVDGE